MKKSILLASILTLSLPSFPLTISEVADQIASANLELRANTLDNEAEILSMRSENTLPATAIEFSPFFTSAESGMSASELIVRQDFEFPTIYGARSKSTHLKRQELQKDMDTQVRKFKADVRAKCIELIYARRCGDILRERLVTGDSLLQAYEKMYALGRGGLLEVNKIKLSNSDLQGELAANTQQILTIEQDLYSLNSDAPINLDGLQYEFDPYSPLPEFDLRTLKSNDAAILGAAAAVEAAKGDVAVGKQAWLPSLSVGYRRNTDGPTVSNGFLVGAEFPLFSIGKQAKAASARLAASNLRLKNAEYEAESRLNGEISRIKGLQASIMAYEKDNSLLLQTLVLLRKSLELGQISITDYYTESGILYDRMQSEAALQYEFNLLLNSLYQ